MPTENSPDDRKRRSFIEQARRSQILEAAVQVMAQAGYANVSLARIAEQADISKSVISYHFSGKGEILRLVVEQFFERGWEAMSHRIAAQDTAIGQVRAWVGAELEFFGDHRAEFLAMSEIVANHRASDGSRPFAEAMIEEIDGLAEVLTRGQRDGELREFDPRGVATIILRSIDGVLGSWVDDEGVDLAQQSAELLEFIDHAIRAEKR